MAKAESLLADAQTVLISVGCALFRNPEWETRT